MNRRQFLRATAIGGASVIAMPLLSACGDDDQDATSSSENGQSEITTDVVFAEYPIPSLSVPYIVGLEDGTFDEYGWHLEEVVSSAGGGTSFRNMAAGEIPLADLAWSAAILAFQSGAPIKIVTSCTGNVNDGLWLRKPETKFDSIEDWVGKKVGYTSPGSGSQTQTALVLDTAGLTEQVETVSTGGLSEGLALLEQDEIDFMYSLQQLAHLTEGKFVPALHTGEELPKYSQSCAVVNTEFLEENRELVGKFLEARVAAIDSTEGDLDRTAELWAKAFEAPTDSTRGALDQLIKPTSVWQRIEFDIEGIQLMLRGMEILGQIEAIEDVALADAIDQSFVPEGQRLDL